MAKGYHSQSVDVCDDPDRDLGQVDVAGLDTDTKNRIGALTETAPTNDTASSGLNGRLQRIAQRLTSLIALLPTALGAGGGLKIDGSGTALPVSVAPATAIVHNQKTVTAAGTEEALGASTALTSGVRIKALHSNTGWVYVGTNPVTSTTGYVLDAGEEVFIEVANLATVFIDVSVSGEGVSYIGS